MQNKNLWAPWRIEYLRSFSNDNKTADTDVDGNEVSNNKCFLCRYEQQPEKDKENLVLWRTANCLVLFNRFPYTGGHMLIAPRRHIAQLEELNDVTMLELFKLTRQVKQVLDKAAHPHGYNVGININRCAGAGLPGHLHIHLVPRWDGDTNFMSVNAGVRVISQALEQMYDELTRISGQLKLPDISHDT